MSGQPSLVVNVTPVQQVVEDRVSTLLVEDRKDGVEISTTEQEQLLTERTRNVYYQQRHIEQVLHSPGRGPPGKDGTRVDYTHTQDPAAATWSVAHNLGFKPSVELMDVGGNEYDAQVVHTSVNHFFVYHDQPTAGTARCT